MARRLDPESTEFFYSLLGLLRILQLAYHYAHTNTQGPSFYGDHLLLQRLYAGGDGSPDLVGETDSLMERMKGLGLAGPVSLGDLVGRLQSLYSHFNLSGRIESSDPAHFFPALLDIEVELQKALTDFNTLLEGNPQLLVESNIGTLNLLQDIADIHQVNVYLLQQRIAK